MTLILDSIGESAHQKELLEELILNGQEDLRIVCPYISEIEGVFDSDILLAQNRSIQIICDLDSGSCNPYFVEKLLNNSQGGLEIKSKKGVHAKVYITPDKAILGSANLTPNGIGSANIDASIVISDVNKIDELMNWFELLWDKAKELSSISEFDWDRYKAGWIRNKVNRKTIKKPHFYDLLLTEPESLSKFVFGFYEDDGDLSENQVKNFVKKKGIELEDGWSYFEGQAKSNKKDLVEAKKIHQKYAGHFALVFYGEPTDDNESYNVVYQKDMMKYLVLPKADIHPNGNVLLYFIYPTDDRNFPYDTKNRKPYNKTSKFINLLNNSLKNRKAEWKRHFTKTEDGKDYYCSVGDMVNLLGL